MFYRLIFDRENYNDYVIKMIIEKIKKNLILFLIFYFDNFSIVLNQSISTGMNPGWTLIC